ncbi:MAG: STAS domain-containing protein [Ruminococcaceae bacterium]|nr:STAS domain-containing protein [Oscillospiraceae bacterium]
MLQHNCTFETELKDGVLELTLHGEIDHHSAVAIRTEMDSQIYELRPVKTILDLSGIEFMDSSGLGLIMGRYALMQKLGGELTLRNPNERLVKIFELAGLGRMVKIEESQKEDKQ